MIARNTHIFREDSRPVDRVNFLEMYPYLQAFINDFEERIVALESGGADATTASNGLTETGNNIKLGGTITDATTNIDTTWTQEINFRNTENGGGIRIYSEEEFSGPTTGSEFNSNFIQFTDGDTGPNSLLAGTDSGGNGSITAEGVTAELNLIGTAGVNLLSLTGDVDITASGGDDIILSSTGGGSLTIGSAGLATQGSISVITDDSSTFFSQSFQAILSIVPTNTAIGMGIPAPTRALDVSQGIGPDSDGAVKFRGYTDQSITAATLSTTETEYVWSPTNDGTFINKLPFARSFTPASSADAAGNNWDIAADESYIYVKTAVAGWQRAALATF